MAALLAWRNILQNKRRAVTVMCGMCASLLLIFMQLGFWQGAMQAAISVFDRFDYQLVMVSSDYQYIDASGSFDRVRLAQARSVPEVEDTFELSFARGSWKELDKGIWSSLVILGVEIKPLFIRDPMIAEGIQSLSRRDAVLVDEYSNKEYGNLSLGQEAEINTHKVSISGHFRLGMSLFVEGSCIVGEDTFQRLTRANTRQITYGFIRIKDGHDERVALEKLTRFLPKDIMVLRRTELNRREQNYFITTKPVGIIFQTGLLVAFIVGQVILFQALWTDISTRMSELATLKAIGFNNALVYGVGVSHALFYGVLSYLFSSILAFWLYRFVHDTSRIPMDLNAFVMGCVLAATLLMCLVSCVLALRRIRDADPVDLFF